MPKSLFWLSHSFLERGVWGRVAQNLPARVSRMLLAPWRSLGSAYLPVLKAPGQKYVSRNYSKWDIRRSQRQSKSFHNAARSYLPVQILIRCHRFTACYNFQVFFMEFCLFIHLFIPTMPFGECSKMPKQREKTHLRLLENDV